MLSVQCVTLRASTNFGWGLEFTITGTKSTQFELQNSEYYIDFHGNYWGVLPAGSSSVADWVLPVKLKNPEIKQNFGNDFTGSFVLQANGLSEALLKTTLIKLRDQGNTGLIFEILYKQNGGPLKTLCEPIFTPSSILQSFTNNGINSRINILDTSVPAYTIPRRKSGSLGKLITMARWGLIILLFVSICWILLLSPSYKEVILDKTPPLISYVYDSNYTFSYKEAVPFHPDLRSQAWKLGYLQAEIERSTQLTEEETLSFLKKASVVTGRDFDKNPITLESVANVEKVLLEMEQNQGLITKIIGFFTFVNMLWLLAIFGISISIGPALYIFLKPLRRFFTGFFKGLFLNYVLPFIIRLHSWGVFELLAWLICITFLLDSQRIPLLNDISFFICVTALAISGPCVAYTSILYGSFTKDYERQTFVNIINAYIILAVFPLTILYQSTFFGFIVVFSIYGILGFSFIPAGLCYYIGYRSKAELIRVAITSAIVLFTYSIFKIVFADPYWLLPFSMPIAICGSLTLYLALLIYTSIYYDYHGYNRSNYATRQIPMVIALLFGLFFGNIYLPNSGFANCATVFLVLYIMEKGTDFHHAVNANLWLLLLFISVCIYFGALHLHAHPQVIVSLFQV